MIISCYLYPLIFEYTVHNFCSVMYSRFSAKKVFEVTLCYIIFVSPFPLVVSLKHIIQSGVTVV